MTKRIYWPLCAETAVPTVMWIVAYVTHVASRIRGQFSDLPRSNPYHRLTASTGKGRQFNGLSRPASLVTWWSSCTGIPPVGRL